MYFSDSQTLSLNLCVCLYLFLSYLCFSVRHGFQLQVHVCNLVVINTALPLLLLPECSLLALERLNHPGTFALPSVCNFVSLLMLLKLCLALACLQQMVIEELRVIKSHVHLFSQIL